MEGASGAGVGNDRDDCAVRIATAADIPGLVPLRIEMQLEVLSGADAEAFRSLGAAARLRLETECEEYFGDSIADGSYVSAVAVAPNGAIVSAVGLVVYLRPPSITGTGRVGYVCNVYTTPAFRRRGLADRLLRLIIETARDRGLDKLHLGATEAGRGVYERVGFGPVRFVALDRKL